MGCDVRITHPLKLLQECLQESAEFPSIVERRALISPDGGAAECQPALRDAECVLPRRELFSVTTSATESTGQRRRCRVKPLKKKKTCCQEFTSNIKNTKRQTVNPAITLLLMKPFAKKPVVMSQRALIAQLLLSLVSG